MSKFPYNNSLCVHILLVLFLWRTLTNNIGVLYKDDEQKIENAWCFDDIIGKSIN